MTKTTKLEIRGNKLRHKANIPNAKGGAQSFLGVGSVCAYPLQSAYISIAYKTKHA